MSNDNSNHLNDGLLVVHYSNGSVHDIAIDHHDDDLTLTYFFIECYTEDRMKTWQIRPYTMILEKQDEM